MCFFCCCNTLDVEAGRNGKNMLNAIKTIFGGNTTSNLSLSQPAAGKRSCAANAASVDDTVMDWLGHPPTCLVLVHVVLVDVPGSSESRLYGSPSSAPNTTTTNASDVDPHAHHQQLSPPFASPDISLSAVPGGGVPTSDVLLFSATPAGPLPPPPPASSLLHSSLPMPLQLPSPQVTGIVPVMPPPTLASVVPTMGMPLGRGMTAVPSVTPSGDDISGNTSTGSQEQLPSMSIAEALCERLAGEFSVGGKYFNAVEPPVVPDPFGFSSNAQSKSNSVAGGGMPEGLSASVRGDFLDVGALSQSGGPSMSVRGAGQWRSAMAMAPPFPTTSAPPSLSASGGGSRLSQLPVTPEQWPTWLASTEWWSTVCSTPAAMMFFSRFRRKSSEGVASGGVVSECSIIPREATADDGVGGRHDAHADAAQDARGDDPSTVETMSAQLRLHVIMLLPNVAAASETLAALVAASAKAAVLRSDLAVQVPVVAGRGVSGAAGNPAVRDAKLSDPPRKTVGMHVSLVSVTRFLGSFSGGALNLRRNLTSALGRPLERAFGSRTVPDISQPRTDTAAALPISQIQAARGFDRHSSSSGGVGPPAVDVFAMLDGVPCVASDQDTMALSVQCGGWERSGGGGGSQRSVVVVAATGDLAAPSSSLRRSSSSGVRLLGPLPEDFSSARQSPRGGRPGDLHDSLLGQQHTSIALRRASSHTLGTTSPTGGHATVARSRYVWPAASYADALSRNCGELPLTAAATKEAVEQLKAECPALVDSLGIKTGDNTSSTAAKDLGVGNVCSMMTSPLIHTQTVLLHEYLRDHVWKSFSSFKRSVLQKRASSSAVVVIPTTTAPTVRTTSTTTPPRQSSRSRGAFVDPTAEPPSPQLSTPPSGVGGDTRGTISFIPAGRKCSSSLNSCIVEVPNASTLHALRTILHNLSFLRDKPYVATLGIASERFQLEIGRHPAAMRLLLLSGFHPDEPSNAAADHHHAASVATMSISTDAVVALQRDRLRAIEMIDGEIALRRLRKRS